MLSNIDENKIIHTVLQNTNILIIGVINDKGTADIEDLKCIYINDNKNILLTDKSEYIGKRVGKSMTSFIKNGMVCDIYNDLYIKGVDIHINPEFNSCHGFIANGKYKLLAYLNEDNKSMCIIHIESISIPQETHVSKVKNVFILNMSHELRQPLQGIIASLHLLEDTKLDQEQMELSSNIKECSYSLIGIMNDILDLAKIEADELKIKHEPVYIQECVESSCDMMSHIATKKGLKLSYIIDPDVPRYILSDFQRIKQILVNLVSNAIKCTIDGYVKVHVESKLIDNIKSMYKIIFRVSDTGIGIKNSDINNLFKKYGIANDGTLESNGLGLYICKNLCELMDGNISVTSEYNKGSIFEFYILTQSHIGEKCKMDQYKSILKGKRALVIDDVDSNRMMITSILLNYGMIPMTCSNAHEGLIYLKSDIHIDIVISDINMPGMNGIQFAKKVKSKLKLDIPLIGLSSIGDDPESSYFDVFLHKPIKEKYLIRSIVKLLADKTVDICEHSKKLCQSSNPNISIIIAEDIYMNRKVMIKLLEKMGYNNVCGVENGLELLDELKMRKYDIVLLDIRMPKMNGLEAATEIRNNRNKYNDPYIIALTASVTYSDKTEYLEKNLFDDFIFKPLSLDEFTTKIDAFKTIRCP